MAMISTVTLNGKSLNPKRFRIQHLPDYTIAERDQERLHVEGRDGDLVLDAKSYKNVPRKYSISFGADGPEDFATAVSEISKWLDCSGYCELEDTYDPEYFWLAVPIGSPKVYSILNGYMGKVDIEFSCQPRKFLKYGRTPVSKPIVNIEGDTTILRVYNPTEYDVLPIFQVFPKRSLTTIEDPVCHIYVAENMRMLNGSAPNPQIVYWMDVSLEDRILKRYENELPAYTALADLAAARLAIEIDCETEDAYPAIDPAAAEIEAYGKYMGDVNQDGEVTTEDADMTLKEALHMLQPPMTAYQKTIADMDDDGTITTNDVQLILVKANSWRYKKNLNSLVTVGETGYPILKAKTNNVISFSGDASRLAVIPRYWTR